MYDDLILHISPDKFFVESLTATQVVLVIDRITYELTLQTNNGQIPPIASRKPIAGILGIIPLVSGPYLVVVTRKARLGAEQGGEVWRVVETEIISYARAEHHLTPTQLEANRRYTGMLQSVSDWMMRFVVTELYFLGSFHPVFLLLLHHGLVPLQAEAGHPPLA